MATRQRLRGRDLAMKCGVDVRKNIGKGSYGKVYKGIYRGRLVEYRDKEVAVKVIHNALGAEAMNERFWTECRTLQQLEHENVVKFIDTVIDEDGTVLIMELMDQTLEEFLAKNKGMLSWVKQADISWQIAFALEYIHNQGVLHRDLTPRNILLDKEGTIVKISDLGQAKQRHSQKPLTGNAPGCIMYMPPECLRGKNPQFDAKGDVFSLCVVMLEVATQQPSTCVWEGISTTPEVDRRAEDLSKVPDNHPLKSLIEQGLNNDPEQRPNIHTIKESLNDLKILSQQSKGSDNYQEVYTQSTSLNGEQELEMESILSSDTEVGEHFMDSEVTNGLESRLNYNVNPETANHAQNGCAADCRSILKEKMQYYAQASHSVVQHRDTGQEYYHEAANDLDKAFKLAAFAKIAGSTMGVTAGVLGVVGGGLLLGGVTAPAGIVLLAVGGAFGVGGGVTGVGATIGDAVKNRKALREANDWMRQDGDLSRKLIASREKYCEELVRITQKYGVTEADAIQLAIGDYESEFTVEGFQGADNEAEIAIQEWNIALEAGAQVVANSTVAGMQIGGAITRGTISGVEAGAEAGVTAARVALQGVGGAVVGLSAVFIVVDLALIGKTAYDIHKNAGGTKLARTLRAAADDKKAETDKLRPLAEFAVKL